MQNDYMYVDMQRNESRLLRYIIISHVEIMIFHVKIDM